MTEIEKRLEEALRALVEQYEAEQRQLAGQVESLQKSVEELRGDLDSFSDYVEELGAEYKVLARDYRRIADALSKD